MNRRTSMYAIVLFVLLWPVVHLWLVVRYELDPWEFFGWAMYSQPPARVQVRVDVQRDGERVPLRAMGPLREAVGDHARRRTALGLLASPDALLEQVFASDPGVEVAWIVERRVLLDRASARLTGEKRVKRFDREGSGAR